MTQPPLTAILLALTLVLAVACQRPAAKTPKPLKPLEQLTETTSLPANSSPNLKVVIDGAIDQVGKTTSYDNSYQKIDYPNGDVPIETGVCSDVVVRAFRKVGIDLSRCEYRSSARTQSDDLLHSPGQVAFGWW